MDCITFSQLYIKFCSFKSGQGDWILRNMGTTVWICHDVNKQAKLVPVPQVAISLQLNSTGPSLGLWPQNPVQYMNNSDRHSRVLILIKQLKLEAKNNSFVMEDHIKHPVSCDYWYWHADFVLYGIWSYTYHEIQMLCSFFANIVCNYIMGFACFELTRILHWIF